MNKKYIDMALETWYLPDHPLYKDPFHPALGLAGEAGELIDLYKKEKFKISCSWWDRGINSMPLIIEELGDLTFYLRILLWQAEYKGQLNAGAFSVDIGEKLIDVFLLSSAILEDYYNIGLLVRIYGNVHLICSDLGTSIEKVMDLNYSKLKGGDNHGWKKARESHKTSL